MTAPTDAVVNRTVAGAVNAAANSPVVELDRVHVVHTTRTGGVFKRDKVYALTDATAAVSTGEVLGVVGESGCGKSTMARVITGLQHPTKGRVQFRGEDLWSMSAVRRREEFGAAVGVVFQDPATALNPRLPVRRILRDPLDVHRRGSKPQRATRVRELLGLVGLPEHVADALPAQLSGGQKQRIAVARALALGPDVIVADEPTSALDVSVRAQVLNLLVDLRRELGLGLVFISHDIQTVRFLADRIAVMYLGRIVEEGPGQQVVERPRHPYTRALLSATPSLLELSNRIVLQGPVPSATHPPSGCPFRTRCWKTTEECAADFPSADSDASQVWHCIHPEPATAAAATRRSLT